MQLLCKLLFFDRHTLLRVTITNGQLCCRNQQSPCECKPPVHSILLSNLQVPIPSSIYTIQEAKFLLQSTHNWWAACQTDSSIARSRLEEAIAEFASAERLLRQAELRAGQARSTIRQSGFGQLLLTNSCFPTIDLSGMCLIVAPRVNLTVID